MFDLPVTTAVGRREYMNFRKFLVKDGFVMMQESVYCKLAQNQLAANALVDHIQRNKPSQGLVQVLTITEKQFSNIVMVVGAKKTDVITTSERMVVI